MAMKPVYNWLNVSKYSPWYSYWTTFPYRVRGIEARERVHGGVLLRVQDLLGGAAQAVGVALVQAEADLAVDALLGVLKARCLKSVFRCNGVFLGRHLRCRNSLSGEMYMPL